ncbi:MAG TPA: hypothetical protein VM284_00005, partial [Candidatus Limnocylindria bacterium]|nr:hypothetical protein [Candidatus Limnocylindria bacterium]
MVVLTGPLARKKRRLCDTALLTDHHFFKGIQQIMHIVKFGLLSAIAIAAVACGGGSAPTPAGATATPAGATATPGAPAGTPTTAPVVPGQAACALITQAEMDIVFGGAATIEQQEDGTCNVTGADSIIPIVIRYGENESISAAKLVIDNGEDLTIAGNPAYYG